MERTSHLENQDLHSGPPALSKLRTLGKRIHGHELFSTVLIGLAASVLTLLCGSLSAVTVENAFPSSWEMIWKQWDAIHYLAIAGQGYASDHPLLLIFPPVYPLLIKAGTYLVENPIWSGLLVANLAFIVSLCIFHQLVRIDFEEKVAELTVLLSVCFPTGYFFHVPYSESTYFALSLGAIYSARKERWVLAGVLGMLGALTRTPGFVLSAVLAAEYLQQSYERRHFLHFRAAAVAFCLPLLGFGVFLFLNWDFTGDPFHFVKMYQIHMGRYLAPPWEGFRNSCRGIFESTPGNSLAIWLMNLVYFCAATVAVVGVCWRLRWSYAIYAILTWVLVFCLNFWMSVPRHLMVCFPLILIAALFVENRPLLRKCAIFVGMFFYVMGLIQFARGWWAN